MNLSEFITKNRGRIFFWAYYLILSFTFCYIFYQKLIVKADFYSIDSSCAIYPVIDFTALKVLQYRMLVPFSFAALKFIMPLPDRGVYFVLAVIQTFIILKIFHKLLNEYFQDKRINEWIAPVILYPMVWNYTILNGQNFFVDFSILIFILLGYYFIIREQDKYLIITLLIGCVNHDSIGFLIPMYLLYNYRRLFTRRVIVTTILLTGIYAGVKFILSEVFVNSPGLSFRLNHIRNFATPFEMPISHVVRNLILVFGGLHIVLLAGLRNPVWKKIPMGRIMINFTVFPYIFIIFFIHSIEEIRNYIAAIPFILIPFLIYMSTFTNTLLKLRDDMNSGDQKTS